MSNSNVNDLIDKLSITEMDEILMCMANTDSDSYEIQLRKILKLAVANGIIPESLVTDVYNDFNDLD